MINKNQKGFSLIELIVTISLISVISAGGMAAYNRFTERQRIVNTGKEIEGLFREAQKKAQSGDKPSDFCGENTTLVGWEVQISSSNKSANLNVVCNEGGYENSHSQKSVTIPADLETNPSYVNVQFDVLTGRPSVVGGSATLTIGTNLDNQSTSRNILRISGSGGIENQGYKEVDDKREQTHVPGENQNYTP